MPLCQRPVTPAYASAHLRLRTTSVNINTHVPKEKNDFLRQYPPSRNSQATGKGHAHQMMALGLERSMNRPLNWPTCLQTTWYREKFTHLNSSMRLFLHPILPPL